MNAADVVYEVVSGAPGRYFRCTRYGLMSEASCARNHAAAPGLIGEGRLDGCLDCPAGAMHSGAPAPAQRSAFDGICVRCRRDPGDESQYRSTRQGKVRMVRNGLLCVSCFNREREVVLGRNARNTKPKGLVLYRLNVGAIVDGRLTVHRFPAVKDGIEAAVTLMRQTGGRAMVCWVGCGIVSAKEWKSGNGTEPKFVPPPPITTNSAEGENGSSPKG